MDIHHLKIFYETCKEKSFTKAAKKLFISQSAVSIQIKKLEAYLSIQLIERNSKSFKLTFAGKELFKLSQDIFNKISRMEKEMSKILKNSSAKIVIGATHNIGEPVLPMVLKEYSSLNKNIQFDIYIKNSVSLIKYIKEGTIDIALMEDDISSEKELTSVQTNVYPFVVIAPYGIEDIETIKAMTILTKDTPIFSKYINTFEDLIGVEFENKTLVNGSNETIKSLVMGGMGISILPYYCVYKELQENKLQMVYKFDELVDKFQLVFLKENIDKEIIENFIKFFKNYDIRIDDENIKSLL